LEANMKAIRSILVPTDFSDCARHALAEAVGFARHFGAELTLLHIYQLPAVTYSEPLLAYGGELVQSIEMQANASLDALRREVEPQLERRVHTKTLLGTPYAGIVEEAGASHHDLIVMATHGHTGLKHLLLGSVAERVVQLAPCPVLTVRATPPTHQ
jgi:nucleotide-binding universal stress UspA family protein